MNGWNRKKTQYLAECIHEHEKADGVTYDPNGMVSYWNTKYNLVPAEQLPALQNQVSLELEALRGAETNHVTISNIGAAKFGFDSVIGNHLPNFDPEPVK
ncbi:hypothetical protein FSG60_014760 [Escherichia coli]|uniref:Uncharacterized protein n=1 Tax=Escherichia coli TaxID=562 RepID=A0A6N8QVX0_ECOLX|nr:MULTISPECIES: hypothetical protein [Escherichia]EFH3041257.1 hypothetical protein [Escherichia coli]EFH7000997.1 hypothetical protein [Escherichia coli]EFN4276637.1 hypothetical protein [Escherichia coli]EFN4669553.1 hypothetical protein [Escherichia coli]EHD2893340.1 hypothetical protein [Escherichia coli]